MTDSQPIQIGILGAAAIVPNALTGPARSVPEVKVVSIAARDSKRAEKFARKHGIPRVHQTYDDLLADPKIDAIYNPLPNGLHAEWTIKALRAGKHVLCEKPFASNAREALGMANAAKEAGKVLSEGFAYRYHPLAVKMKDVIGSGELGTIQHIEARFCFLLPSPSNIRFKYELAGGVLMDAGCYPVSLVRFLMEAEPTVLDAKSRLVRPQVDSRTEANLSFPNNVSGHIVCDMLSPRLLDSMVKVQGSTGVMRVINPYHPLNLLYWMTVRTSKGTRPVRVKNENVYAAQLRAFAKAVRDETPFSTNPDDAVNNMRVIDAIYKKAGLALRGE